MLTLPRNKLTLLLLFVCFICLALHFYFSRNVPIRIWDEAIYANNSLEMRESGNLLVLQNNGSPSLYNTKPPLAIWLQSLSMVVFGINEFALRLPSYLASFVTIAALILFLARYAKQPWAQVIATLVMLTSSGYLGDHIGGTADLDSLTACLLTLFTLNTLRLCLDPDRNADRRIWLSAALFLLSFFAKSTTVLLTLPGLFICVIYSGRWRTILFRKSLLLSSLAVFAIISGYYFLVNQLHPGYCHTVWFSEVERFYKNVMPWHQQTADYYFLVLADVYLPWCYLILPAFIICLFLKPPMVKKLAIMLIICAVSFFIFITIPSTKLAWYLAPIYPLLALIISLGFSELFHLISASSQSLTLFIKSVFILYCGFLFYSILQQRSNVEINALEQEGNFLKSVVAKTHASHVAVMMTAEHPEHFDQLNFYRKKFSLERKGKFQLLSQKDKLHHFDTVLVCQQSFKDSLNKLFSFDTILWEGDCLLLRLR